MVSTRLSAFVHMCRTGLKGEKRPDEKERKTLQFAYTEAGAEAIPRLCTWSSLICYCHRVPSPSRGRCGQKRGTHPPTASPAGLDSLRPTPPAGSRVLPAQDPSTCNHPRGPVGPTGNGVTG